MRIFRNAPFPPATLPSTTCQNNLVQLVWELAWLAVAENLDLRIVSTRIWARKTITLGGVPFLCWVVWLTATVVGTFPRKSRFFWLEMTRRHGRQLQQWWTGVMRVGAISFLPTLLLSRTWAPTSALPHTLITRLSLQPNRLDYCFFLLNFVRHYSDHHQSISCRTFWQLLCFFVKVEDS